MWFICRSGHKSNTLLQTKTPPQTQTHTTHHTHTHFPQDIWGKAQVHIIKWWISFYCFSVRVLLLLRLALCHAATLKSSLNLGLNTWVYFLCGLSVFCFLTHCQQETGGLCDTWYIIRLECSSHYKGVHAYFFGPSIAKTEPVRLFQGCAYNRTRDSEYSFSSWVVSFPHIFYKSGWCKL